MSDGLDVGIEGVRLIALTPHPDERGSFTEAYRRSWLPEGREMVQGNLSFSSARVLRGLHFHRRQADYWCVVRGSALVGLHDLREGSPSQGKSAEVPLSDDEPRALYIPKGVAHGFFAQTDLLLYYLVDEEYSGEDEFGIAWDDPEVGIGWPDREPILSERDRTNPGLAEVLPEAPRYEG